MPVRAVLRTCLTDGSCLFGRKQPPPPLRVCGRVSLSAFLTACQPSALSFLRERAAGTFLDAFVQREFGFSLSPRIFLRRAANRLLFALPVKSAVALFGCLAYCYTLCNTIAKVPPHVIRERSEKKFFLLVLQRLVHHRRHGLRRVIFDTCRLAHFGARGRRRLGK